jgi:hypothetical protein
MNDALPPTSNNYFPPPQDNTHLFSYLEKNGYNNVLMSQVNNRGYQQARERTSSPNTAQERKIEIHPEEREIFQLYKKLEVISTPFNKIY